MIVHIMEMKIMNFGKYMKIISLVLVFCLTTLAGVFAAKIFITNGREHADIGTEKVTGKRVNILLLATDKGNLLTDTIMFISVDKERKVMNVMSIPRDTRVKLGNSYAKINSVYGAGKEGKRQELIIEKINEITGLPVNYYAVVNIKAFRQVIDILGGVEINVPMRMYYNDPDQDLLIDLQPGRQVLNGAKAEQFCRFRSGYANADLGRIDAQQTFVKALVEQKLKPQYLLKAGEIADAVLSNISTNIDIVDINNILPVFEAMKGDAVYTCVLPGAPQMIGDASYYIYDKQETDKIINEQFLGIE